jgi:SAM-dependent methyltransferase
MNDARRHAPAALRNRDAILAILRDALPSHGLVLEVASGSGEHVAHFARALPAFDWQPSDPDPGARASIDAWVGESGLPNVRPALALNAAARWPIGRADAILCINMVHISPWTATLGLLAGAARLLPPQGLLYLYGPYRVGGVMAPSNADFDDDLRRRDPAWGVRDLEAVTSAASDHGLRLDRVIEMPANNLSVLLRRD